MKINDIVNALQNKTTANETLELLFTIAGGKDDDLVKALVEIIANPGEIDETALVAMLIEQMPFEEFIEPLTKVIQTADPKDTPYLIDYLQALASVLEELEETDAGPAFDEQFVHLLGTWLFDAEGELSWKAATVISYIQHPACHDYLTKAVKDQSLFYMARQDCLRGLVNQYAEKELELYKELTKDGNEEIAHTAEHAIAWCQQ
jgi:hypothetical protein